jgi:nitroreductase
MLHLDDAEGNGLRWFGLRQAFGARGSAFDRRHVPRHKAAPGRGYLADHIHEAPVWIVPCLEGATPTRTAGSSIYPAVQNMLLAARALGLGATLTTLYLNFEKKGRGGVRPTDRLPMGRFGPVRRVPLADVVYEDRWGQPFAGT